ncbi:hypothetical protein BWI93_17035 [Siphonobacter sp. BAB-5385]|uniref:DUF2130 domain-containing protein n=1 Tax=Siphonobacter sp. BAB-5385 TaxID=1864822 RepID=UPI000B9E2D88|nr:DUF2130 domain-containing protein [Siphonobacter sp. BAB-5385]OZI07010.1 hypothetical protein BWI93_17035 [Siphonobacter sp. BAB-5385]
MQQHIHCPQCQHEINIESVLAEQIEARYRSKWSLRSDELNKRAYDLHARQTALDAEVERKLSTQRQTLEAQLRQSLQQELTSKNAAETQQLRQQLSDQSSQISQLRRQEGELLRKQRELEEAKAGMTAELERQLASERQQLEARAMERAQQQSQLALQERDTLIRQLNERVEDMKRKMEQGSMQVQGEAQEAVLEQVLKAEFPFDAFEEIKKGENGADLVQSVRNAHGKSCGTILYESKRTKVFNDDWLSKLKADMQLRKADVGVLVTQTLPKGCTRFELRQEGIVICTLEEVIAVSKLLRSTVMQVDSVKVVQANQGTKTQRLYEYMTGREFATHLRLIHDVFEGFRQELQQEKKQTQSRWKRREKMLDSVLDSMTGIVGSINGIAGHALAEFDDFEELPEPAGLLEE